MLINQRFKRNDILCKYLIILFSIFTTVTGFAGEIDICNRGIIGIRISEAVNIFPNFDNKDCHEVSEEKMGTIDNLILENISIHALSADQFKGSYGVKGVIS